MGLTVWQVEIVTAESYAEEANCFVGAHAEWTGAACSAHPDSRCMHRINWQNEEKLKAQRALIYS